MATVLMDLFYQIAHEFWLGPSTHTTDVFYYDTTETTSTPKLLPRSLLPSRKLATIRLVCISDIHGKFDQLRVPEGEILFIAGDLLLMNRHFSRSFSEKLLHQIARWMESLPHPSKYFIGGNHDQVLEKLGMHKVQEIFQNSGCVYLEDTGATTIEGLKIWGSPFSQGKSKNDAFQASGEKRLEMIKCNPCDILLSHGPIPRRTLDEMTKPMISISGHYHKDYGMRTVDGTLFINAAVMNHKYKLTNAAVVVDIDEVVKAKELTPESPEIDRT